MKRKKQPNPKQARFVIAQLGGTSTVAGICDISMASVSQWKKRGLPDAREQFFRLLRPDVFERFDNQNARRQRRKAGEVERTNEERCVGSSG